MALIEVRFDSETLDLSVAANVLLPDSAEAWREPPAVLYLLHGLSDDHTIWCRRTAIERHLAGYPLAVVMPDVQKSFCCDMAHGADYFSFLADELPALVGRWFNVSPKPEKTFVAGLSMGGYGAMKLALERSDRYAAAASLSGALDLAAHVNDDFSESRRRAFEAVFGEVATVPGSVFDLPAALERMATPPPLPLYLCVGTEDYLREDSRTFHAAAKAAGANVVLEEGPGEHSWSFWDRWLPRVLEWLPVERRSDS